MEQSNDGAHFPRTVSNDNSVWTVEGSQHQLAPTNSKSENISLFSKLTRRRLESYLTASLFAILLLLVALLITIYLVTSTSVIFPKVCYSPNCIRSAANLLESMNTTANPCDNFFKYACGRWRTNHAAPEPYWTNSWFIDRAAIQKRDVIGFLSREDSDDDPGGVKDARKVYRACLNLDAQEESGLEYLWTFLDQIGLPRNPFNKTFTPNPWVETMARTRRYMAMNLFIGSSIMPSIANSTLNQLMLSTPDDEDTLPGWNWERRKFYSELKKKMSQEEEDEEGTDVTAVSWVKYGSRIISYLVEATGDIFDDSEVLIASDTILQIIRNISAIQESENVTGSILNEIPTEMNLADVQTIIDEASASGDSKNATPVVELSRNSENSGDFLLWALKIKPPEPRIDPQPTKDNYIICTGNSIRWCKKMGRKVLTSVRKLINETLPLNELKLESYFDILFSEFSELELNFTNDKLLVYKKPYFALIAEYLENLDDSDINLFIWWNVVYTLASHTNEDLKLVKENFVRKIIGDFPTETRSSVCMQTVYTLMSQALGFFISQKVEETRVNKVHSMIHDIRGAFISFIQKLSWMDGKTKSASIDKLNNFNVFVGTPEWMKNRTEFDELYVNVTLAEDDHFHNIVNLLDAIMVGTLESLRITNDHSTSEFDPLDINAYYDPSSNSITVPYGILQFPFYDLGIEALNYGAIGTVLGHEMTHGFDNTGDSIFMNVSGRKFDKLGNVHSWWSNSSVAKYTNRTTCFESEYTDFALPQVNTSIVKIDGKLTLGENLADDGGLKFALNAYQTHVKTHGSEPKLPGLQSFTHDQLFFLSFANLWCSEYSVSALLQALEDEHSPDFVRVLVVLQNSPEFSDAFSCPKGSYMNPNHKCKLWTR